MDATKIWAYITYLENSRVACHSLAFLKIPLKFFELRHLRPEHWAVRDLDVISNVQNM